MKLVSIIGDSISTFEGYNPPGYSVFYDKDTQIENGLNSVYDTWWAKVNETLHADLCVNNSYSGSKVTGTGFPSASSNERLGNLGTVDYSPDIILIYIGFNDFGNGVKVSRGYLPKYNQRDLLIFEEAYDYMLNSIKHRYPYTKVVCGTLMRTTMKNYDKWVFPENYNNTEFEDYNKIIRKLVKIHRCYLADVGKFDARYETLDGAHPTAKGHLTIAREWIKCLMKSNLIEPSIETCIKMYHANKQSEVAEYAVISSLLNEKVLVAVNGDDGFLGIPVDNQMFIPIFTSPNEVSKEKNIQFRTMLIPDYIELLISLNMDIIINPFSKADIQFVVSRTMLKKMVKKV